MECSYVDNREMYILKLYRKKKSNLTKRERLSIQPVNGTTGPKDPPKLKLSHLEYIYFPRRLINKDGD